MNRIGGPIGLLAVALLAAGAARASGWPQYKRDSARTGDASDEKLAFPMQRIVAVRFPAPIYASPAVVGGKVYIQDARGNVACVDVGTNKVLWTAKLGGVTNTSSPAVAKGKVYVGSSAGYLAVLDAASGKLIKKIPADGQVITSPAVTEEGVYFSTTTAQLVKTDFDGNVIWTFKGKGDAYTEFAVRGKEILFVQADGTRGGHTRLCMLLDEGKTVKVGEWSVPLYRGRVYLCPTGGMTFGDGGQYSMQGYDSEAGGFCIFGRAPGARGWYRGSVGLLWRTADVRMKWNDSRVTASYRAGRFYRGDICCSAKGYIWRADPAIMVSGGSQSSPALAKDHLAVGNDDGKVLFFPIEAKGAEPARTVKATAIVKPVWSFMTIGAGKPNGAISSSPAISGGRVFFGGEDGVLYGLGRGPETKVVDALPKEKMAARTFPGRKLKGTEWHTPGGGMGYSAVSADTTVKPPFKIKWRTRVWNSGKGPVIVAAGMAFHTGRTGQLVAMDAETGEVIWRVRHTNEVVESRPAAVYAEGKLLVLRGSVDLSGKPSGGGGIWCHDARTGRVLWKKTFQVAYPYNSDGLIAGDGKVLACLPDKKGVLQAAGLSLKDGSELWRRSLDIPAGPKGRRFAVAADGGLWFLSVADGRTFGLNPADGKILWKTEKQHAIQARSRIAARKGTVVVFNQAGGQALNAKTGAHLWTGRGGSRNYSAQPLTDLYLESHGKKGASKSHGCSYPVFANGTWYFHKRGATFSILRAGRAWSRAFLSNTCPSVSPAYGRLYYMPCGEGVVYCFEPTIASKKEKSR